MSQQTAVSKTALITGITGQDGAYLSKLLLEKGYVVHGLRRRSSTSNTSRIDHLLNSITLHYGDVTDGTNLVRIIQQIQPDEIYNLAAMSQAKTSFETPEYTAETNGLGVLKILEAIRILGLQNKTRLYQASTSELFGIEHELPQSENTPFSPRSPYAIAKLYAYWITVNYREAYKIFACNGILFNHESPLREETFVSRKITKGVARLALGLSTKLLMGSLNARRDWGHAKDYVKAMWLILQQNTPDDYVVATGINTSIKEFLKMAFQQVQVDLEFKGQGLEETGIVRSCGSAYSFEAGQEVVKIDPVYFRPEEANMLIGDQPKGRIAGDARKAHEYLGWQPHYSLKDLIAEMMAYDLEAVQQEMNSKIEHPQIEW